MSAKSLQAKILSIQRNIDPVQMSRASEGDEPGFAYVAAADVFESVRPHLKRRKLLVLTQVLRAEGQPSGRQMTTRAKLAIALIDTDSNERWDFDWMGEGADESGKALQKAITSGLKSFYLTIFQIPSVDTAQAGELYVTRRQINGPIYKARKAHGFLAPHELKPILQREFAVEDVRLVPRNKVDKLVAAIKAAADERDASERDGDGSAGDTT